MSNLEKFNEIVSELINLQSQSDRLLKEAYEMWESLTDDERNMFRAAKVDALSRQLIL